jgi:hypothetical protein
MQQRFGEEPHSQHDHKSCEGVTIDLLMLYTMSGLMPTIMRWA